jgi:predicted SprT family Zn-dependent metalloprotease
VGRGGEDASKGVLAHKVLVRVELSTKVLDDEEKLKQTLCHELCHVAAWVENETRQPPHGPAFKYWAGVAAQRCPGMKVTTCHNYDISFKFRYQCQLCLREYGRHSKSINLETARCGACRGTLALLPRTNQDGTPAKRGGLPPRPPSLRAMAAPAQRGPRARDARGGRAAAPNGYAQFVKEHFSAVKAKNPALSAPEVLKALSEKWRVHKEELRAAEAAAPEDPPRAA